MGEIADSIINGEVCQMCGVYLEPNETVYVHGVNVIKTNMPKNGDSFGIPVTCEDCYDD